MCLRNNFTALLLSWGCRDKLPCGSDNRRGFAHTSGCQESGVKVLAALAPAQGPRTDPMARLSQRLWVQASLAVAAFLQSASIFSWLLLLPESSVSCQGHLSLI